MKKYTLFYYVISIDDKKTILTCEEYYVSLKSDNKYSWDTKYVN